MPETQETKVKLRVLAEQIAADRAPGAQAYSALVIGAVCIGREAAVPLVLQGVTVTRPWTQAAQPNRGR